MNQAETRWEQLRKRFIAEVGNFAEVVCRIPGWEPESLEMGLRWLRSSVYEGFYVDFRVEPEDAKATIWFKIWEYGEPEPDWDSIINDVR
jgi:hypothetical protein